MKKPYAITIGNTDVLGGGGSFSDLNTLLGGGYWLPLNDTFGDTAVNALYSAAAGAELVVNGNFAAWSGVAPDDTPDGWATLNQSPPNTQLNDATNAVQFVSDNTAALEIKQTILTLGESYDLTLSVLINAGSISSSLQRNNFTVLGVDAIFGQHPGPYRHPRKIATAADFRIRGASSPPWDKTFTGVSVKKVGEMDGNVVGPVLNQAGPVTNSRAALFDGSDDYIQVYHNAAIAGNTTLTALFLLNPTNAGEGDAGAILFKTDEFVLQFNSASRDLYANADFATTDAEATTTTALTASTWQTVAVRLNADKTLQIFIDGVEATYASRVTGDGARVSNSNHWRIGNNASGSQTFAGLLGTVRYVPDVITNAQIAQWSAGALLYKPDSTDTGLRPFFSIGDSKTSNTNVGLDWPRRLVLYANDAYPTTFWSESPTRLATGGWTIADVKAGIDAKLAAATTTPRYVLINAGTNDISTGTLEAAFKADYQYVIDAITTKWPGIPIYMARPLLLDGIPPAAPVAGTAAVQGWVDNLIALNSNCFAGPDETDLEGGDSYATNYVDTAHYTIAGTTAVIALWMAALGYPL